jgi:hypothetical protein
LAKQTFVLGYHLVAFLDVQGQRERFKQLRLATTPDEQEQIAETLRATAGFVLALRELFQTQFEVFEQGAQTPFPVRPKFLGFSDSFVTSVPLRSANDRDGVVRSIIVLSALSAAAIVVLTSLSQRHPLRGGIDVGLATEIGPTEIYGTALEKAYVLESKIAEYPRVVIGDELIEFLSQELLRCGQRSEPIFQAIRKIIEKVQALITQDKDGKYILDFLGAGMVEHAGPIREQVNSTVRPAYDFVLKEYNRFLESGDAKLSARYAQLKEYFESRLNLWGLEIKS